MLISLDAAPLQAGWQTRRSLRAMQAGTSGRPGHRKTPPLGLVSPLESVNQLDVLADVASEAVKD